MITLDAKGKVGRMYRYKVKSTGYSSARFGPCQVCKEHVSEVFTQREHQLCSYMDEEGGSFWAINRGLFGHEKCLKGQRKKPEVAWPKDLR